MAASIEINKGGLAFEVISFSLVIFLLPSSRAHLKSFNSHDVLNALQTSCFIGVNVDAKTDLLSRFDDLAVLFQDEESVTVGKLYLEDFVWPNGGKLSIKGDTCHKDNSLELLKCIRQSHDILYFPKIVKDRSCLLTGPEAKPRAEPFTGPNGVDALLTFVNAKCGTFRLRTGAISPAGILKEDILSNLFTLKEISNLNMSVLSMKDIPLGRNYVISGVHDSATADSGSCEGDTCSQSELAHGKVKYRREYKESVLPKCHTIQHPISKDEFFNEYLKRSKPVIIKDAVKNWPAVSKWTQEYFRNTFGERDVHVKMTPGGDFEGVEKAELWENFETFKIPKKVKEKLLYPDLVVVRPAGITMKFREFLDLITWAAQQTSRNVSAYLEYSSIPEYMPELREDLEEFDFVSDVLTLRHLNIWLSDGNTLGRLHFDPYDNFLCQLSGRKQVILFEPHDNQKLYEAHIPEAILAYSRSNHSFHRKSLEDSTSMVMSPVDLLHPDFERFPKFGGAHPLNCTIEEGDALFMPSFWWHEVYSWPSVEEKRNLAVNFWYEPFLTKEFPCPECKMDVNSFYHHLLY